MSAMTDRYAGLRVLLTGAASGIGKAVAARVAAEGAAVASLDLTTDPIETGHALACDVSDPGAVDDAVAAAVDHLGGLDVVFNIAGIGHFRNSHDETADGFSRIVAVNLTGTFNVCRATLPHLLANEAGGAIVNTASTAGLIGQPWSAAYCASKGGVVMLTKALAFEYRSRGVRVNAVAPGGVDTPIAGAFAASFPADADMTLLDRITSPMGMMAPADAANAFAFVGSPEARYMTGAIVAVDGGVSA
jgi:NAD(P)-dependent dehydrogenase (short-subunit alcohol dehydrogenase family)